VCTMMTMVTHLQVAATWRGTLTCAYPYWGFVMVVVVMMVYMAAMS